MKKNNIIICVMIMSVVMTCVKSATNTCRQNQFCDQCLLDPGCGWCASSGACVPGKSTGPSNGNCTTWEFYTCPAIPSWITLGNSPSRSGVSSFSSSISRERMNEPIPLYNYTYTSPPLPVAVALGLVFVVTSTAIMAHNENTGQIVWSHEFGQMYSTSPPSFSNGSVFTQITDGNQRGLLYSFDAIKGKVQWTAPYSCQWEHYLSPLVYDGRVCVNAGTYGGMYCYVQETGEKIFYTSLPQYAEWTPSSMDGRLFAYVSSNFYEFDNSTGQVIWQKTVPFQWTGYDMLVAAVIDIPYAFIPIKNNAYRYNQLVAIDVDKHAVAWNTSNLPCGTTWMPAVSDSKVYLACNYSLYVLDKHDGSVEIQTTVIGNIPTAQPIVTPNEVIVAYDTGVFAFSLPKLDLIWSIASSSPDISYDGRLFITNGNILRVYQV